MLELPLIIFILAPLVDNTYHVQLYQIHCFLVVNAILHNMLQIHLNNPDLPITDDKQYYTCPATWTS